ncbi:MAG: SpoVG family protein [Planctomycetota bacterium]|nr:SpoVG family protein [Planctomycetota bacterium]
MSITEIRIKLTDDPRNKLKAYCSVTIDDALVIRDLKIIEGTKGPFVAMPSRKLADHCPHCHHKNHLRASFCNQCGKRLEADRAPRDDRGRARLHADLAHPINSPTRLVLHRAVVSAYQEELEHARRVGDEYRPRTFDDLDYLADGLDADYLDELERRCEAREREREQRAQGGVAQADGAGRSESAVEAGE